jgi:hypothetical protein
MYTGASPVFQLWPQAWEKAAGLKITWQARPH